MIKGMFIGLFSISYYRTNEVEQFQYSRPFRKGEKDPDNEFAVNYSLKSPNLSERFTFLWESTEVALIPCFLQTMWIERTTYITAYRFPGILKWFEVKSVSVVRILPRGKTLDFHAQTDFKSRLLWSAGGNQPSGECHRNHGDGQWEARQPGAAAGVWPLAVHQPAVHDAEWHRWPCRHGRILQLWEGLCFSFAVWDHWSLVEVLSWSSQAFFTDTYIQEHPEDQECIEVLKHLIALQVTPSPPLLWTPPDSCARSVTLAFPCRSHCWRRELVSMGRRRRSSWSRYTTAWSHVSRTSGRKSRNIMASSHWCASSFLWSDPCWCKIPTDVSPLCRSRVHSQRRKRVVWAPWLCLTSCPPPCVACPPFPPFPVPPLASQAAPPPQRATPTKSQCTKNQIRD